MMKDFVLLTLLRLVIAVGCAFLPSVFAQAHWVDSDDKITLRQHLTATSFGVLLIILYATTASFIGYEHPLAEILGVIAMFNMVMVPLQFFMGFTMITSSVEAKSI